MPDLIVRPEQPGDYDAIRSLVAAAFDSDAEPDLVEAIRASEQYVAGLALVAERDGEILGHVMISYAELEDDGWRHRVALLAPLAVRPDAQRTGVGTALLRESVATAEAMGEPMVVLEGGPRFYGNRGFEPSDRYGITMRLPDWAPADAAQVHRLAGYDPGIKGRLVLPPTFDGVE